MRRGILVAALAAGLLAASAAPALASFHSIMVQEVFPGSTADPGEDYVTLQMHSPGQNLLGGHTLTVYAAAGTVAGTATFPASPGGNVVNGANQSTILIGATPTVFGVPPDLEDSDLSAIDHDGGAVCWETFDCVSWGSFIPPMGGLPSPAGTPSSSPGGISDGTVLTRKYALAGCTTLLDPPDDTNDSNGDLAGAGPVPRNNGTAPTEQACPDTTITKGPTGKTFDRTPTFKFKSLPPGAPNFFCAIDDQSSSAFSGCSSPFTLPKQSFGRHKLFVEASNSIGGHDHTPAKQAFRVVRKR